MRPFLPLGIWIPQAPRNHPFVSIYGEMYHYSARAFWGYEIFTGRGIKCSQAFSTSNPTTLSRILTIYAFTLKVNGLNGSCLQMQRNKLDIVNALLINEFV